MATSNYLYKLLDAISVRNGNVGIGTDYPSGILQVQGTALFDHIGALNSNINFLGTTLSNVQRISVQTLTTQNASSNIDINNKTLSNVGYLYVNNHATVTGTLTASNLNILGDYTILNTATSNTEQFFITNNGTGPALRVTQAGFGPQFAIAEFIDNETNLALKIADTGLIGINTDTPTERVHIFGESNVTMLIQSATNQVSQVKLQNAAGQFIIGPSSSNTVDLLSTANQPLRIGTNSNVQLYLTPTGRIGVGTTTPLYQLDVGSIGVRDTFVIRNSGANRFTYGHGGVTYTSTGPHTIGLLLTWANTITDPVYSFRISGKFHVASATYSSAYRRFDSIVSPVDDAPNNRPSQLSVAELADFTNGGFGSLSHTITRAGSRSVQLTLSWNANVQPAIGYLDVDIFVHTALGDFTFAPTSS